MWRTVNIVSKKPAKGQSDWWFGERVQVLNEAGRRVAGVHKLHLLDYEKVTSEHMTIDGIHPQKAVNIRLFQKMVFLG